MGPKTDPRGTTHISATMVDFLHPEIPRWRTDTGSSYNFATENDINVILAQTRSTNTPERK